MKEYAKIDSFKNLYNAELYKEILMNNDINAFILNKRDCFAFSGEIELYTNLDDEKKAKQILAEFQGLTKINSFVELRPILLFQKILQANGIKTKIKTKENDKYIMSNYELYVENEDFEKVIPFLNGEKLEGWDKIKSFKNTRQAQQHIKLLEQEKIDVITIKKRDSNLHLIEIQVYVKSENKEISKNILKELKGYVVLRSSDNYTKLEVDAKNLIKENIIALIRENNSSFELLIKETENYKKADQILINREEWVKVKSFNDVPQTIYTQLILNQNDINSVILNEKASNFLIGNVELYVEKNNYDKAMEIIKAL